MYERMFESFISLFIPFYDKVKSSIPNPRSCSGEFMIKPIVRVKSNVIEQGAEPIYLHIVPPIIKPYIKTLDAMLQLLLLVAVIIEVFVPFLTIQYKLRFNGGINGLVHVTSLYRHSRAVLGMRFSHLFIFGPKTSGAGLN